MEDMVHSQDHQPLSIDEITSPLGAQLFEFCESDLFPETVQNNSEHASTSTTNNGINSYEEQSSTYHNNNTDIMTKYSDNEINNNNNPPPPSSPTTTANTFSIIFDDDQLERDISASIDFSNSSPNYYNNNNNNNNNQEAAFNVSLLNNNNNNNMMNNTAPQLHQYERWVPTTDDCLSSLPPYIRFRPACSIMDPMMPPFLHQGNINISAENSGIFGGLMLGGGGDLSHQELDFQGDSGGLFMPDNCLPRVFNCSSELQTLSSESQHLVHGGTSTTPITSEISSLDDPTFKVGKLSVEERKRKIDRYMQKRNERNFSKKIKYACRKTLADSRPRVRGRFAKNDELGEIARANGGNHEDDIDDDINLFSNSISDPPKKVGMKEEDELESADIFAHISGVNSFKCNYPIQSWI